MSGKIPQFRLDEILVNMGLITEKQVQEALVLQKKNGGRFGSILLYNGYIDEAGLVRALATQNESEGVVISQMEIHELVKNMVSKKVAVARKVMPFDYDPENNILKVACMDPSDEKLKNEIGFVARGKEIKLYIAAEIALNTVIAKSYLGMTPPESDEYFWDIPEDYLEIQNEDETDDEMTLSAVSPSAPSILLVTDDEDAVPQIKYLFERDNYRVLVTDTADDAIEMLDDQKFHTVFIKDTVSGDYIDLIERVRKISPRTVVRYYDTESSLILNENAITSEADMLMKNMDLFTSLLSSKAKLPVNHSGQVGQYAERLCRAMGIPAKERILISNAAYIHDLSRFYYDSKVGSENQELIGRTVKLLSSLNYSPVVIEILRTMYHDLKNKYTKRLPIEVLGGNILTIVDLFCDSIPHNDRLSLDKFDTITKKLRDLIGKLFLPEVVESFIEMIKAEILDQHTTQDAGQVLIFAEDISFRQPLELRLKNEGFRTVSHSSPIAFVDLYRRSEPDLMVMLAPGTPDAVNKFVDTIEKGGVNLDDTPAFLLTESVCIPRLTNLLDRGVEDILPFDNNLEMLVSKIRKLMAKISERNQKAAEAAGTTAGARGRLADMNLIDLLQALGPSRKTVKITVAEADSTSEDLTLYLDKGQIIHAALNDLEGAEAVYAALEWSDGSWTVEPANPDDFPPSNNDLSNESILMEGCRLMDEKSRETEKVK